MIVDFWQTLGWGFAAGVLSCVGLFIAAALYFEKR